MNCINVMKYIFIYFPFIKASILLSDVLQSAEEIVKYAMKVYFKTPAQIRIAMNSIDCHYLRRNTMS